MGQALRLPLPDSRPGSLQPHGHGILQAKASAWAAQGLPLESGLQEGLQSSQPRPPSCVALGSGCRVPAGLLHTEIPLLGGSPGPALSGLPLLQGNTAPPGCPYLLGGGLGGLAKGFLLQSGSSGGEGGASFPST